MVVTGHQTAGRGRRGRDWVSPPGASLLASVLLRPDLPPDRHHLAVAAVALAGADAVEEVAGFRPSLKWPNDLVVPGPGGDRKLAGVLAEGVPPSPGAQGAPVAAVVVGIGVNLNWGDAFPAELAARAASADGVAGHRVDADAVLAALLAGLGRRCGRWQEVASEHRRRCSTIGRMVRVELADEVFAGTAADVDDAGRLLVDVGMCLRAVSAADVVHLR